MSKVTISNSPNSNRDVMQLRFTCGHSASAPAALGDFLPTVDFLASLGGNIHETVIESALFSDVQEAQIVVAEPTTDEPFAVQTGDAETENGDAETENVTQKVRTQYEKLPYPFRDPENDKKFLMLTMLDNLMSINQHCFQGKRNFNDEFRILVAGGGTGDASTFLATQIAWLPNAHLQYLDLSTESLKIAKQRLQNQAQRLGLTDIERKVDFRIGSLLEVEKMGIGKFDLINCSGVLHHLKNPSEGLGALRNVLKSEGALSIMVYGQIGRTSIYQIQDLMRLININTDDVDEKIANTNLMLRNLPANNIHRRDGRWMANEANPIEVHDLFLHCQDRAYTIDQLYDWVESQGLNIVRFGGGLNTFLDRETLLSQLPMHVRKNVRAMSERQFIRFAELHFGHFNKYEFYATAKSAKEAGLDMEDWDIIPEFSVFAKIKKIPESIEKAAASSSIIQYTMDTHTGPATYSMPVDAFLQTICRNIDGIQSMKELINHIRRFAPKARPSELRECIFKRLDKLISCNMMQFRHPDGNVSLLNRYNF